MFFTLVYVGANNPQQGDKVSVRAKFRVISKTVTETNGVSVQLQAVSDGSEENKEFFKWTPAGNINLSTINEAAGAEFNLNDSFYVDFIKAES